MQLRRCAMRYGEAIEKAEGKGSITKRKTPVTPAQMVVRKQDELICATEKKSNQDLPALRADSSPAELPGRPL